MIRENPCSLHSLHENAKCGVFNMFMDGHLVACILKHVHENSEGDDCTVLGNQDLNNCHPKKDVEADVDCA